MSLGYGHDRIICPRCKSARPYRGFMGCARPDCPMEDGPNEAAYVKNLEELRLEPCPKMPPLDAVPEYPAQQPALVLLVIGAISGALAMTVIFIIWSILS